MTFSRVTRSLRAVLVLLAVLPVALSAVSVQALTVSVTPRMANIVPGTNSPVQLLYTGLELPTVTGTYLATSTSAQFEALDGTILGTVDRTVTLNMVNHRGVVGETLIVPARIMAAAQQSGQGQIRVLRVFTPNVIGIGGTRTYTQMQIVPGPAGEFALIGLRLEFNQPAPTDAVRPQSGGRITVPRNTAGLRAAAVVTYNGQGLLRGRWVVDGQVLGLVTKQLVPGLREAVIASPTVPALPTYATGLHTVRFEIIDPVPSFELPLLRYFVTGVDVAPQVPVLTLAAPADRAHLALSPDNRPAFSWNPLPQATTYLLRIFLLEPDAADASGTDTDKPMLSVRTDRPEHTLSRFDLGHFAPDRPYAWEVRAFIGNTLIGVSPRRIVIFSGLSASDNLIVPLRDQGTAGK